MNYFPNKASTDLQQIFYHEAVAQLPAWVNPLDSLDDSDSLDDGRRRCSKSAIRSGDAIGNLETSAGSQGVTITEQVIPYSGGQVHIPPFHISALYLLLCSTIVLQIIIVWNAIRRDRKRKK